MTVLDDFIFMFQTIRYYLFFRNLSLFDQHIHSLQSTSHQIVLHIYLNEHPNYHYCGVWVKICVSYVNKLPDIEKPIILLVDFEGQPHRQRQGPIWFFVKQWWQHEASNTWHHHTHHCYRKVTANVRKWFQLVLVLFQV